MVLISKFITLFTETLSIWDLRSLPTSPFHLKVMTASNALGVVITCSEGKCSDRTFTPVKCSDRTFQLVICSVRTFQPLRCSVRTFHRIKCSDRTSNPLKCSHQTSKSGPIFKTSLFIYFKYELTVRCIVGKLIFSRLRGRLQIENRLSSCGTICH